MLSSAPRSKPKALDTALGTWIQRAPTTKRPRTHLRFRNPQFRLQPGTLTPKPSTCTLPRSKTSPEPGWLQPGLSAWRRFPERTSCPSFSGFRLHLSLSLCASRLALCLRTRGGVCGKWGLYLFSPVAPQNLTCLVPRLGLGRCASGLSALAFEGRCCAC